MATRKLSELDEGVRKRLREARLLLGLTLDEFARQAGISRSQLEHYEYGRARLPLDVALRICHRLLIGEHWLATGDGHQRYVLDLSLEFTGSPKFGYAVPQMAFVDAWKMHLEKPAKDLLADAAENGCVLRPELFGESREFFKNHIGIILDWAFDQVPDFEWPKLHFHVQEEIKRWLAEGSSPHLQSNATARDEPVSIAPLAVSLDTQGLSLINQFVTSPRSETPHWDDLLKRLRLVTSRRGSKAELANKMRVTKAAVSQWLAGRAQPSAENTLHMLRWVEGEESKKTKRSGSVPAPPDQRTQQPETVQ